METILERLRAAYGAPPPRPRRAPLDELVQTILSQNTSDRNSGRAYRALRERFPRWSQVMEADPEELVAVLRPGGLARQKAPRIQAALRALAALPGGLRLAWLDGLPDAEALARLTALPGVGTKTASCVLLFSLGRPVMPVDTHVLRVARRLGLVPAGATAERAHAILTAATPAERMLEAHLLLIEHGRRTCRARRPACERCPLLDLCPFGRAALAGELEGASGRPG
jgi:endonuclease III